jgi:hypothetical protein
MNPNFLLIPVGIILITLAAIAFTPTGEPPYWVISPAQEKIETLKSSGQLSNDAAIEIETSLMKIQETHFNYMHPYLGQLFLADIGLGVSLISLISLRILCRKKKI